jgi:hypothetical protein
VRLDTITGVARRSAEQILAELGDDIVVPILLIVGGWKAAIALGALWMATHPEEVLRPIPSKDEMMSQMRGL